MVVPAHVKQLHKPHAALGEPPGQQAVEGITAGPLHIRAIGLEHMLRLIGEIDQLRHALLHAKGHLILAGAGRDIGICQQSRALAIERCDPIERAAAQLPIDAGWISEIEHRIAGVAKFHPLVPRR